MYQKEQSNISRMNWKIIIGAIGFTIFAISQFVPAYELDGELSTNFIMIIFLSGTLSFAAILSGVKLLLLINVFFIINEIVYFLDLNNIMLEFPTMVIKYGIYLEAIGVLFMTIATIMAVFSSNEDKMTIKY